MALWTALRTSNKHGQSSLPCPVDPSRQPALDASPSRPQILNPAVTPVFKKPLKPVPWVSLPTDEHRLQPHGHSGRSSGAGHYQHPRHRRGAKRQGHPHRSWRVMVSNFCRKIAGPSAGLAVSPELRENDTVFRPPLSPRRFILMDRRIVKILQLVLFVS